MAQEVVALVVKNEHINGEEIMGVTLECLSKRELPNKCIFHNRMVIELCEQAHFHYRNLRIIQTLDDFIEMANGFNNALERWKKRGCPGTGVGQHIELCRKNVAMVDEHKDISINLNKNLYKENVGQIFAEGANFHDETYIHLKIRDTRIELSIEEFKLLTLAMIEAHGKLPEFSNSGSLLQAT